MAEDVETPPQEQPPKLSVDQFAEKIKAKYPDYAHIDNKTLTDKILAKYPEYGDKIDMKPVKPLQGVIQQPTNFLPTNPQDNSLIPVLPQNRAQVKQQQIQDAHANAIQTAQQQRLTTKQPLADNLDRSMMDRVSQAVYLPSLKQGFNDLVIKPLAGATDFVDRTVDKAYTAVTGDKTPDWMRESKNSIFKSVSDQIQKEYDTRDKPKNIVSDVAEGTIGALPLMASLFTGEGEAKLAMQAPQFISKATKLFATTGALNAFKDATDQGDDYGQSVNKSLTGAAKGTVTGLTLDAQMLAAGALGKGVVNQLAEKGLLKGGKAGEALIHALATGTIFGGTSAGQDLLDGKDVDTHEAAKQFGMGLAFETIPVAKGLADAAGDHIEKSDINKKAAQQAATVTAASNLNGEGALRTLMTTPAEQLLAIKNNIPDSHETLYANSVEQGMKAYEEKNVDEKKSLYADQLALKTQGDVKLIESKLKDNAPELIQSINDSTELQPEQKQDLLQKIEALTPKNEQAEPNREIPAKTSTDEAAGEETAINPTNETTKNNKITFKTGKGSTYEVHEDGTTTRNKAERSDFGHEGQKGPQPRSSKTVYVTKDDLGKLDLVQAIHPDKENGAKFGIVHEGDKIGVAAYDKDGNGKVVQRTIVKPETEPKVGLYPVEIWDGHTQPHFGNEITEVNSLIKPTENESTNEGDGKSSSQKGNEEGSAESESGNEESVPNEEKIVKSGEDKTEPDTIKPVKKKVRIPHPEFEDIRTTAKSKHGEDTSENLAKETNAKTWYHGSNKDLTNEHISSAAFTRPDSLLGLGFYMTDNPEIAEKYANLRRNKDNSKVNEFNVKTSKILDAEKPIDNNVSDTYKRVFQTLFTDKEDADGFFDDVKKANPNASLMDYHKAIYEHIADEHIPTSEVTEHFQDLEQSLKDDLGYDGISHIGGKVLGGRNHNVMILFDPSGEYSDNRKPFVKKGLYEAKYQDAPPTEVEVRQKAIDAITHGIIGDGERKQGDTSARFDLGMNTAEQKRAIRDITNGDYETAPAKKMIDKVTEFEKNGEYPIIEGQGGSSVRNRFATPDDIQQHIDDAKQFKLAKEQDIEANNKGLRDLGITHEDVQDYENYRNAGEPGTIADNGRTTENTPKDVQRPENDKGTSGPQSSGGEATQGEPTARELATQTRKEAKAKLDALKNNLGIANDPEKKAKALFEYHKALVNEAKEYIKEGVKNVSDFAKSIGEKVDDSITKAWNEATGKTKTIESHKEFAETGQPADTTEPDKEDPSKIYGTKNSVTEALRDGMGMPPIEIPKDRSEDASLNAWKDGTRTPLDIIDGLLDPNTDIYDKAITPNDEPIIREYIKQLGEQGAELNKAKVHLQEHGTPEDVASVTQQLANHYDQMERALNASKIGGNIWHKYGAERQVAVDEQGLVVNSIERIKNIYGTEIPEEVKSELKDLQAKYDNLLAKQAKIEEQIKAGGAVENFEKAKPKRGLLGTSRVKKTDVEFKKEREDIVEKMKRDFKKSFGQLNATLPGVPQFNAIAPHVTALMKSFAEQGVSKVDDVIVKVHDIVKDVVDGITKDDIRDIIAGKYGDKKPLSDLQKQLNDLRTQARNKAKIEELEKGIVSKTRSKGEASLEVKTLQKQLQELKKQAVNEYADLSTEGLKKQAKTIQTQIDKGDYFKIPTVKRKWETDPEWVKANKEKAELNFRLRKLEREALDSKKGKFMRALDWGNRWGRRVIFFGANAVYTKLASAAVLGSFIHRIPEQALGRLNANMFPHIARNAPIEGYTNASAEGKFYSEFLNPAKFIKNTKDILLTGETDLSKELGKQLPQKHIPGIDLFAADAHIMIKDPVKRATFEASLQNHLNWYEKNGVDPTHPLMLESARQAAYKRAEYEIFQNSEQNSNKIKQFFSQLEKTAVINKSKPDIWNKHVKGNAQYTAAALYHFMIPINTVPVNILKRVGLGLQLPATYLKAIADNKSVREGTLNMTSEESDAIMLHLKKGQVSAAYWTLGFVLAGSAAGGLYTSFYSDKERDKTTDVQDADYLNFRGVDVSKNIQHNTQFQALQMGATWGIVYNHYIDDGGESQLSAMLKASAATAGVAAKEHPVIEAASNVLEAVKTPHGNTKFVKDLKRRVGVKKAQDIFKLMGYDVGDDDE